jgi:hypothetical protein
MSSCRRKRSPLTRSQEIEPESFSSPCNELKKPETKIALQETTEPQKQNRVNSHICGFSKTQTKTPSQEVEKCEGTKITGSSIMVKKPKTRPESTKIDKCGYSKIAGSPSSKLRDLSNTIPSMKANICADSRRESSPSFEVKEEANTVPCEQTQDCSDLEMATIHQYQFTDLQLKEPGVSFQKSDHSDDVSGADSCFREFKRLKQRILELDNERAVLTEAIGNETGLTANMQQLHEYNTIKDITQIIIGSLSNILQVPVTQLHQELNLNFQE